MYEATGKIQPFGHGARWCKRARWTRIRKITLKIEFAPDAERKTIGVSYTASSKLIPMNPISTSLYVGTDPQTGEIGAVELTPQIPGQKNMMDDSEQLEGKVIPITRKAALAR